MNGLFRRLQLLQLVTLPVLFACSEGPETPVPTAPVPVPPVDLVPLTTVTGSVHRHFYTAAQIPSGNLNECTSTRFNSPDINGVAVGGQTNWRQIYFQSPVSGTYTSGGGGGPTFSHNDGTSVTITVNADKSVSFSNFSSPVSTGVDVFVVKGGEASGVEDYREAEATSGGPLGNTPTPQSGSSANPQFQLSHILLCYDPDADARIVLVQDGANEVGNAHTFTATFQLDLDRDGTFAESPTELVPAGTLITFTKTGPGTFVPAAGTCTTVGTTGSCSVQLNSAVTGTSVVNASATVTPAGFGPITRDTDPATPASSGTGGSGPATKIWVDAFIKITPDGTNPVGQSHTFEVEVQQNAGAGFAAVADGTKPVVTIAPAPGTKTDNCASTGTVGGKCTVVINSAVAGAFVANASIQLTISTAEGNVVVNRDTDPATATVGSGPGGSGPATKEYVDVRISITPDDANEVGVSHTFTVTVEKDVGAGFVGVQGVNPVVTLSAVPTSKTDGCAAVGGTNASGQCTVVINSDNPGTFVANASITIGAITRDTDPSTLNIPASGAGQGNGPATKVYVDAAIDIAVDDINGVGEPHTFTVTVTKDDDGSAATPPVAAAGVTTATTIATVPPGPLPATLTIGCLLAAQATATGCTGPTNASGVYSLTINSTATGTFKANAGISLTIPVTINGVVYNVLLVRDTDPNTPAVADGPSTQGDGPATKVYVDGTLRWFKQDNAGNLLGGATFEVCRTVDDNPLTTEPACFTVFDNANGVATAPDVDPTAGEIEVQHLPLGTYTISETIAPSGFSGDPDIVTATLTTGTPSHTFPNPTFTNTPTVSGGSISIGGGSWTVLVNQTLNALSGNFVIENQGVPVSVKAITVTLQRKKQGSDPQGTPDLVPISVTGCSFSPSPTFTIQPNVKPTVTVSGCDLGSQLGGGVEFKVTVVVELNQNPGDTGQGTYTRTYDGKTN